MFNRELIVQFIALCLDGMMAQFQDASNIGENLLYLFNFISNEKILQFVIGLEIEFYEIMDWEQLFLVRIYYRNIVK